MPSDHFDVLLTAGAEQDLEAIYDYIADYDAIENADYVLEKIMALFDSLSQFPERGNYPKELLELGIKTFRQVAFKPYRVIYRVAHKQVFVYIIADDRRDLQGLVLRRLLCA